ncbi:MAG: rRNA maturation RNase YbeY [Coriobacteriales bacterium]|jgi:probable rRNA maturation factor|nr:rRNA maturation RNase YbeY [Coriobacteriales bacterium]
MLILVDNRSGEELPEAAYQALAEFVLTSEGAAEESELSVSLIDVREMHALNLAYRGIDAPTDVLAFENDWPLLGDVIICPEVAREHARDFSSDFASEMELMLTHGILHLCGYDHESDASAEAMEAREAELLQTWKTHKEML